jgi:hypothetical protein
MSAYRSSHHTWGPAETSQRPQDIPYVPVDIGSMTQLGEQRLLGSLLCVLFFYDLRTVVGEAWPLRRSRGRSMPCSPGLQKGSGRHSGHIRMSCWSSSRPSFYTWMSAPEAVTSYHHGCAPPSLVSRRTGRAVVSAVGDIHS